MRYPSPFTLSPARMLSAAGLILLFSLCACHQDVVDLDLSEFESNIVIEGAVTDRPGPYTVRISKTVGYKSNSGFPRVSGAEVVITDDTGYSEPLTESGRGSYQTSLLRGVPGRTYTLRVRADGKTYTASCRMPVPLELKDVVYTPVPGGAYLRCEYRDPAGEGDCFRMFIYKNGNRVQTIYFRDRFHDGKTVVFDEFDTYFQPTDEVRIDLVTLDTIMYEYYKMLDSESGEGDFDIPDFLAVTAYNPATNLTNGALGYFSAHSIKTYRCIIELD